MNDQIASVRKRILMFYFAAGLNLFMGIYVLSAGSGVAPESTIAIITLIFFAFAILNFYVARMLRKRLEQQLRQHGWKPGEEAKK